MDYDNTLNDMIGTVIPFLSLNVIVYPQAAVTADAGVFVDYRPLNQGTRPNPYVGYALLPVLLFVRIGLVMVGPHLKKLIDETNDILVATGKENRFTMMIILSLILMVVGSFFAVAMNNLFILPVFAIGFALMPFWYLKFLAIKWKKELNNELETALSIITTSYLRCESIITAIDENIDYINPPVYDVFKAFLMQTKLINSNMKIALNGLKDKVDSPVFHEWVNAVIDCQEDKNLKSTLTPIVSKLSDMRIVSAELDYLLFEPVKEFISMAVLLVGNIPLMYFLNRDWYETLMYNTLGKVILAICGSILFVSIAGVVRLSKPIEYRR